MPRVQQETGDAMKLERGMIVELLQDLPMLSGGMFLGKVPRGKLGEAKLHRVGEGNVQLWEVDFPSYGRVLVAEDMVEEAPAHRGAANSHYPSYPYLDVAKTHNVNYGSVLELVELIEATKASFPEDSEGVRHYGGVLVKATFEAVMREHHRRNIVLGKA